MSKIFCGHKEAHEIAMQRAKEGILSAKETATIAKTFQLLADPTRLKIVFALLQGEMCVYHLTEVCGGTVSATSHQLRVLKDNGIVRSTRQGKFVEYAIADEHVREIVETAVAHLACESKK